MRIIYLEFFVIIAIIFLPYNLAQGSHSQNPSEVSATTSEGYLFTELKEDLLTVDIRDVALEEVLKELSAQNDITFLLPPSLGEEKVMVRFSHYKIDMGLNKILAPYNRIFIYTEENPNPDQAPLTRLKEVRIYPRSYEENKKGKGETTAVRPPQGIKPSRETKINERAAKGDEKKKPVASRRPSKNKRMSVDKIKAWANRGGEKAIGYLASALKDKSLQVRKEAEKALEEIGESLREESEGYEDLEESLPSEGGEKTLTLAPVSGKGVNLELSNDVPVRGVQFTLDGAKPTEVRTTSRTEGFFAKVNEKNGTVVMVSLSGKKIAPGTGPIAEIICDKGDSAHLTNIKISE